MSRLKRELGSENRRGLLGPCSLPLEGPAVKENLPGALLEEFSRALRAGLEAVHLDLTLTPN